MATGTELILGFQQPQFNVVAEALGIQYTGAKAGLEESPRIEEINLELKKIHKRALKQAGFHDIERASYGCYVNAVTPLGPRQFSPFMLALYFDPNEMGDGWQDATFGIAISGRYFPTFADWKSEHGCLYPIVFEDGLNRMMRIARTKIVRTYPIFKKASWIVKELFY